MITLKEIGSLLNKHYRVSFQRNPVEARHAASRGKHVEGKGVPRGGPEAPAPRRAPLLGEKEAGIWRGLRGGGRSWVPPALSLLPQASNPGEPHLSRLPRKARHLGGLSGREPPAAPPQSWPDLRTAPRLPGAIPRGHGGRSQGSGEGRAGPWQHCLAWGGSGREWAAARPRETGGDTGEEAGGQRPGRRLGCAGAHLEPRAGRTRAPAAPPRTRTRWVSEARVPGSSEGGRTQAGDRRRALPFTPGAGAAAGGQDGDPGTPACGTWQQSLGTLAGCHPRGMGGRSPSERSRLTRTSSLGQNSGRGPGGQEGGSCHLNSWRRRQGHRGQRGPRRISQAER